MRFRPFIHTGRVYPGVRYWQDAYPCIVRGKEIDWVENVSENKIRQEYYPYWCAMLRKQKKEHLIDFERCIDDWVVVNWATQLK